MTGLRLPRLVVLLLLPLVLLLSRVSPSLGGAFPAPRGDPEARPPSGAATAGGHPKHALLELIESAQPIARPSKEWIAPDVQAWIAHGSLAQAFRLAPLSRLEVPIYVNVLCVGLDGSGRLAVTLDEGLLAEWMQHLDHIVAHNILRADSTSEEDAASAGDDDDGQEAEHTASTKRREAELLQRQSFADVPDDLDAVGTAAKVQYRYHIRLIHLSAKVIHVVERYLGVHYRVENKEHTVFQVDAEIMNGVLDGLVSHLRLNDAYNLFVLNPSLTWLTVPATVPKEAPITYGYRSGFSNDELETLLDRDVRDASVKAFLADWPKSPQADYAQQLEKDTSTPQEIPIFTPRTEEAIQEKKALGTPQLTVLDHREVSDAWATSVLNAPHFTGPQPLASYLAQQMDHHPQVLREQVSNPYAHEDCLTDNWIGKGRSIFLDLSAGPFRWGPLASGGEGVRTNASFPSVNTFVSHWQQELAELEENEGAGDADGFVDAAYDADATAAELLVLEDILVQKRCREPQESDEPEHAGECRDAIQRLADLKEWAAEHQHRSVTADQMPTAAAAAGSSKQPPALHSPDGMSYFHDEGVDGGAGASGHDTGLEVDHFLAHLSATLSGALHHVLTPTVAGTQLALYAREVHFHLYVLVNHQQYDPLAFQFFHRLKYGLEQLRLPSQTFVYTVHKLTMDDDPALAMAYTDALKSTVVPSVLFDGRFSAIKRLYIDAATLQEKLRNINLEEQTTPAGQPSSSSSSSSVSSRSIPIFLFSLDFPLPVLVDKFHQSVAVPGRGSGVGAEGMVVAVQSNLHLWESPHTCNEQPMFWNLRDPLRPILTSVAQLLGGLLPMHVKYSPAHGKVKQDWLWSVGASPMALTSASGIEFSQIQRDTLHRKYVLTAWRRASRVVNQAIVELAREKTEVANRMLGGIEEEVPTGADGQPLPVGPFSSRRLAIQSAYTSVTDTITREMVPAMEEFHFDAATLAIEKLEKQANQFAKAVRDVTQWNRRQKCKGDGDRTAATGAGSSSSFTLSWHWYLLTAIGCAGIILYRLIVQRDNKPKLN